MSATGPELQAGEMIPGTKYRIVKSLGAGGMGVVYQVVKPPNIGGVLKLMSTELTEHQEHRMRFFDEVRILAQLDHPNIVKVFDYDALPDGTPFYVMELLSGRTVRDVIYMMGRVPPRVAYEITRQLLEALQAAHTHEVPVIHRDIKPENIFLHAPRHGEPVVKLIDFGVSAVADRKHDGAFVGTWSYAAPEQIRGERPTPATDLYAAGLVLYEMLAGVGPFDHYLSWLQISEAQLKEIPAPVSKFAPWVPPSIVALIASALAKDPRARPRDAYAFAERLYELEWASDGANPHDLTTEGPLALAPMPRDDVRRTPHLPRGRHVDGPVEVSGSGPLSRVLSTVTSVKAPSKNMAAAKPAPDRLGDVPLIGVPPESVRSGPTWRGVGDLTAPDTTALLDGLGATPKKPSSRRERESGPELGVVGYDVRASGQPRAAPRGNEDATAPTLEMADPRALPGRDTFSSQQSDARALPLSRMGVVIAGAIVLAGVAIAGVVLLRGGRAEGTTGSAVGAGASTGATTTAGSGAGNAATAGVTTAGSSAGPATMIPAETTAPLGAQPAASAKTAPRPGPGGKPSASTPRPTVATASASSPNAANAASASPAPKASENADFIRHF